MNDIIVSMHDICKSFPGVKALDHVDFELRSGEVMALLGENGAGKSTLMKVLSGVYTRDSGDMEIQGKAYGNLTPKQAQAAGVAIIHQELNMCRHLTVAENMFLGREKVRGVVLNQREMEAEAAEVLGRLKIDISPRTVVGDLPISKQQMVEIAKALSMDARILIMDEPTSALTAREIEDLFRIIRDLRAGRFDVLVGINLLREGLDIPEVSLVAILDADKEGFLRSERSLIQTIGRAARNLNGRAILYADRMTDSMERALAETGRRREKQLAYNAEHGIVPRGVKKEIRDIIDGVYRGPDVAKPASRRVEETDFGALDEKSLSARLKELEARMMDFARNLDFEKAAQVREEIKHLREQAFGASAEA